MNRVQHYFSSRPEVASHPAVATLRLPDLTLELVTDSGVFAHGMVDHGTELLLRAAPHPPAGGDVLDLGCGYGAIAVVMALRAPRSRIWAVDVNQRALELTRDNAARHDAANVTVSLPDALPASLRFDVIYSNPPVRIGKDALHDLLDTWLQRLRPGASAYLVVQRHLGSDSLAAWLDAHGTRTQRLRSKSGYRLLAVHSAA